MHPSQSRKKRSFSAINPEFASVEGVVIGVGVDMNVKRAGAHGVGTDVLTIGGDENYRLATIENAVDVIIVIVRTFAGSGFVLLIEEIAKQNSDTARHWDSD